MYWHTLLIILLLGLGPWLRGTTPENCVDAPEGQHIDSRLDTPTQRSLAQFQWGLCVLDSAQLEAIRDGVNTMDLETAMKAQLLGSIATEQNVRAAQFAQMRKKDTAIAKSETDELVYWERFRSAIAHLPDMQVLELSVAISPEEIAFRAPRIAAAQDRAHKAILARLIALGYLNENPSAEELKKSSAMRVRIMLSSPAELAQSKLNIESKIRHVRGEERMGVTELYMAIGREFKMRNAMLKKYAEAGKNPEKEVFADNLMRCAAHLKEADTAFLEAVWRHREDYLNEKTALGNRGNAVDILMESLQKERELRGLLP